MRNNQVGKVSGVYSIKVLRNAGTEEERLEDFGESDNMLLDNFFDRFSRGRIESSGWRIYVGTGANAVNPTQTSLTAQVGGPAYAQYGMVVKTEKENDQYVSTSTYTAKWNIGAVVGNMSEVGVRMGTDNPTDLDSRALITDNLGNPTSITVTDSDQLVITYKLKLILPTQQQIITTNIGGVDTTCTLEMLNIFMWNFEVYVSGIRSTHRYSNTAGLFNNVETMSTGISNSASSSMSKTNGVGGTKMFSFAFPADSANKFGSIKYLVTNAYEGRSHYEAMGLLFDPPIPKDSSKTLTLNFSITIARA